MPRTRALVLAAVAILAMAGCTAQDPEFSANDQVAAAARQPEPGAEGEGGEGEGGGGGGPTVEFAAGSALEYTEAADQVPAGGATFELACEGLPHNVAVEGFQGGEPIVECPGEGVFTGSAAIEPGDYTYFCSIPGHRAGGMEGEFTVE